MQCIKIEPGKEPELCEIDNKLKALQTAVGGHIEHYDIGNGLHLILNEEGTLQGLEPNCTIRVNDYQSLMLFGTVLVVRAGMEDFLPVRDGDLTKLLGLYHPMEVDA